MLGAGVDTSVATRRATIASVIATLRCRPPVQPIATRMKRLPSREVAVRRPVSRRATYWSRNERGVRPADDVVGHRARRSRSAARSSGSQNGLGRNRMSATKSASTGMPYLKPKLTTVTLSATVSGVPNASATRSVSWWTLRLVVSMTRSASLRRRASTTRSRWSPSSSRPSPCSGWGRRAASCRRTSASSVASRNTRVVRRPVAPCARLAWRLSKKEPERTSTTTAIGCSTPRLSSTSAHDVLEQRGGHVVDDVEAEVLQLLGRGAAAGAGHAGDDDQLAALVGPGGSGRSRRRAGSRAPPSLLLDLTGRGVDGDSLAGPAAAARRPP